MPLPLQRRIREYYKFLWLSGQSYHDKQLFDQLPESLALQLDLALKRALIESVAMFRRLRFPTTLALVRRFESVIAIPNEVLSRQGDTAECMFFLAHGSVEVYQRCCPSSKLALAGAGKGKGGEEEEGGGERGGEGGGKGKGGEGGGEGGGGEGAAAKQQEATSLLTLARAMQQSALVCTGRFLGRKYHNILRGNEVVDWLVGGGIAADRAAAVELGKALVRAKLLRHSTGQNPFKDEPLFYNLTLDDGEGGGRALVLCTLTAPDHFGELDLLDPDAAKADSTRATSFCELQKLWLADFQELAELYPDLKVRSSTRH